MVRTLTQLRTTAIRILGGGAAASPGYEACTWDQLRAVYEEQAARGVPEAVRGLERMDQGCWPSDGSPRKRGG